MTGQRGLEEKSDASPIASSYYFIIIEDKHGLKMMNSLGKRCSFQRALAACEAAREAGYTWAVAFDRAGLFMTAVTPWDHEGFGAGRDVVIEASKYRNQSLALAGIIP